MDYWSFKIPKATELTRCNPRRIPEERKPQAGKQSHSYICTAPAPQSTRGNKLSRLNNNYFMTYFILLSLTTVSAVL